MLWTILVRWPLWLASSLLTYFLLVLLASIAWRAYKTYLVRRVRLLAEWHLKPVGARQAVLVTGATSGIGLAVAKHLYARGYSIIGTYYNAAEPGYAELERLGAIDTKKRGAGANSSASNNNNNNNNNKLLLVHLDVRRAEDIEKAYTLVEAWLAANNLQLYALINNAGLGSLQPFAWLQRANIRRLVDTNLLGYLLMTREFLPLLAKCGRAHGSRLIFVSSGLGFFPGATYATYGLTKCAQHYLAQALNTELKARYGVQSVAVIPHNFIKSTNICAANVETNEQAWQELKPIERELYRAEFSEHLARAKLLDKSTRQLQASRAASGTGTGTDIGTAGTTGSGGSKRPSAGAGVKRTKHALSSLARLLRDIVSSVSGEPTQLSLEESGALECFEDALRLRNPPEQIFAGDSVFQLLIGSLIMSTPGFGMTTLGASIAQGLYK